MACMSVWRLSKVTSVLRFGRRFTSRYLVNPGDAKFDSGPSYYIVPEIPSESYLSNKLLQTTALPNFENAQVEEVFGAFSRMLMDCQLSLSKLSERIKNKEIGSSTEDLLLPLEEILYPIDHAFQILENISILKNDPVWLIVVSRLFQKVKAVKREYLHLDPEIYSSLVSMQKSSSIKSEHTKGLLDVLLNEFWENGAEFAASAAGLKTTPSSDKYSPQKSQRILEQLRNIQVRLDQEEVQFQSMVLASAVVTGQSELSLLSGHGRMPISESDLAPSTPDWLPYVLGGVQTGGHIAGMRVNIASDDIVKSVLKHCSTRPVREAIWYAWVQRASLDNFGHSSQHQASNPIRIQLIRRLRNELAKTFGYPDWLSFVWHSNYRRSPSTPESLVDDVLEPLRTRLADAGRNELKLLSVWASSNLDLHGTKLEPWDIEYAIQQYNYAASYHQEQTVITPPEGSLTLFIEKIFSELAQLFSLKVTVKKLANTGLVNSEECTVFGIEDADDGTFLGDIVLDIFRRPDQAVFYGEVVPIVQSTKTHLATDGVHLRPEIGKYSTVSIVGNFNPSAETEGIQYENLISIVSCFGMCLQHVASRVLHHQLSGLSHQMALDSRHLAGDLFASIVSGGGLQTLSSIPTNKSTDHYTKPTPTGIRPPPKPLGVLSLLRQLYEARFDLELWSAAESNNSWVQLNQRIWSSHLPYPMHRRDSWLTSCGNLFGPNSQSGLLYHRVWRSALRHDTVAALSEAGWHTTGLNSSEVTKVLQRFKNTYLANGAALPPAELFRRFRGRDLKVDFLLQSLGYLDPLQSPSVAETPASPALVR